LAIIAFFFLDSTWNNCELAKRTYDRLRDSSTAIEAFRAGVCSKSLKGCWRVSSIEANVTSVTFFTELSSNAVFTGRAL
jgi:hypothetical protein